MKQVSTFFSIAMLAMLVSCSPKIVKIACVGDSITEGSGIRMQSKFGYPVALENKLGADYAVINCGRSATTLQKNGDFPYWTCNEFHNVFSYRPDIIVIKLGTNDTKPQNWNAENYTKDYQALIDTFKTIASNPKIYVCLPVPVYETKWGISDSTIINGVIPAVKAIAQKNQLQLIDLYSPLSNHSELFPDKIHPNEEGARIMAETIGDRLKK